MNYFKAHLFDPIVLHKKKPGEYCRALIKKPEKSRPASMRLRKAGLSGFPVISYLQNRSISPKRPFFHNRKPMQKGDIAAVQRDPKDKTLRLRTAGNQSNESDGRFAPILGRDVPRSSRCDCCHTTGRHTTQRSISYEKPPPEYGTADQ